MSEEMTCNSDGCDSSTRTDSVEFRRWTVFAENEHSVGSFGPDWNDIGVIVGQVLRKQGGDMRAYCPACVARMIAA